MPRKTYGWVSKLDLDSEQGPTCVYLDTEGNEVYLSGISSSDTKNPFPEEALCIGQVTTFVRFEDPMEMPTFMSTFTEGDLPRSILRCLQEIVMNPRQVILLSPDTGQTGLRLMASAAAGVKGAKEKICILHGLGPRDADIGMSLLRKIKTELDDPTTLSVRPLKMRKATRFDANLDINLRVPKEFLEAPLGIDSYVGLLEKTQEEPELPDGQGSVAPTKGKKRRFPRPR